MVEAETYFFFPLEWKIMGRLDISITSGSVRLLKWFYTTT